MVQYPGGSLAYSWPAQECPKLRRAASVTHERPLALSSTSQSNSAILQGRPSSASTQVPPCWAISGPPIAAVEQLLFLHLHISYGCCSSRSPRSLGRADPSIALHGGGDFVHLVKLCNSPEKQRAHPLSAIVRWCKGTPHLNRE
eukprot:COSAG01_NODE_594_length_15086_cov_39.948805_7_plen_144_part_00